MKPSAQNLTVDEVLSRRQRTATAAHIAVTAMKSVLAAVALVLSVVSRCLSGAGTENSVFGLFLLMIALIISAAAALFAEVSLIQNFFFTHLFGKIWMWVTVAGLAAALLFFLLEAFGPRWNYEVLYFVWTVLQTVPSGFEIARLQKYLEKKKSNRKEGAANG